jgi:hypothetical protein
MDERLKKAQQLEWEANKLRGQVREETNRKLLAANVDLGLLINALDESVIRVTIEHSRDEYCMTISKNTSFGPNPLLKMKADSARALRKQLDQAIYNWEDHGLDT